MANITIKFPEPKNDYEASVLFQGFFTPAFYLPERDTIVLTKKICEIGYREDFYEILGHEHLHEILCKLESTGTSKALDNIDLRPYFIKAYLKQQRKSIFKAAKDVEDMKNAMDTIDKNIQIAKEIIEGNPERLIIYFNNAKEFSIKNGYGEVINDIFERIDLVKKTGDCHIDAIDFLLQYVYAVLNSGINNKAAETMYARFLEKCDPSTIKHEKKREAITKAMRNYQMWFHEFSDLKHTSEESKLEFLGTLPFCGKANQYLMMRNFGFDVVKPDIHLIRLAKVWGFSTPKELCQQIQKYTGEYLGVIDLILWFYCSKTHNYGIQEHL